MTGRKPHHHGNLRAALIRAGIDLIAEGGAEALTIRKAASRAGVSHAAPAHHFPTLAHLRAAVIAEGYRRFHASMETGIAAAPDTPRGALVGAATGYVRFATENPGLFQLMFGGALHADDYPELLETSEAAYGVLRRICAPLAPGPAGTLGNELLVWSIVHGFSSLAIARGRGRLGDLDPVTLITRIFPDLPLVETEKETT